MKTVDREKLWEEYQKKKTPELREKLIIEYSPLVKLVAGRLSMYLGYNVEYDDRSAPEYKRIFNILPNEVVSSNFVKIILYSAISL